MSPNKDPRIVQSAIRSIRAKQWASQQGPLQLARSSLRQHGARCGVERRRACLCPCSGTPLANNRKSAHYKHELARCCAPGCAPALTIYDSELGSWAMAPGPSSPLKEIELTSLQVPTGSPLGSTGHAAPQAGNAQCRWAGGHPTARAVRCGRASDSTGATKPAGGPRAGDPSHEWRGQPRAWPPAHTCPPSAPARGRGAAQTPFFEFLYLSNAVVPDGGGQRSRPADSDLGPVGGPVALYVLRLCAKPWPR